MAKNIPLNSHNPQRPNHHQLPKLHTYKQHNSRQEIKRNTIQEPPHQMPQHFSQSIGFKDHVKGKLLLDLQQAVLIKSDRKDLPEEQTHLKGRKRSPLRNAAE